MKSILEKLSPEELKQLSKSINESQAKRFGNPLSLRKQEKLMADIFNVKNWSTALGLCDDNKKYEDEMKEVMNRNHRMTKKFI